MARQSEFYLLLAQHKDGEIVPMTRETRQAAVDLADQSVKDGFQVSMYHVKMSGLTIVKTIKVRLR